MSKRKYSKEFKLRLIKEHDEEGVSFYKLDKDNHLAFGIVRKWKAAYKMYGEDGLILFYNRIFAVTFDEDFTKATGTKAEAYNLMIAIVIAVIIVLAMNLVGSLLISALVIFPALSAMRIFNSFKKVTVCSAILSVISAFAGIVISILAGAPVGATIVAVDAGVFLICCITGSIKGKGLCLSG